MHFVLEPTQVLEVTVRSPVQQVVRSASTNGHHIAYLTLRASASSRQTAFVLRIPAQPTPGPISGSIFVVESLSYDAYLSRMADEFVIYSRLAREEERKAMAQASGTPYRCPCGCGEYSSPTSACFGFASQFNYYRPWAADFSQPCQSDDPPRVYGSFGNFHPYRGTFDIKDAYRDAHRLDETSFRSRHGHAKGSPAQSRHSDSFRKKSSMRPEERKFEPWWPNKGTYTHAEFVQFRRFSNGRHPFESEWCVMDASRSRETHNRTVFLALMADYWRGKMPRRNHEGWCFFYPYRENPECEVEEA